MTVVEKIEHALGIDESKPGTYRNPPSSHCLWSKVLVSIGTDIYPVKQLPSHPPLAWTCPKLVSRSNTAIAVPVSLSR